MARPPASQDPATAAALGAIEEQIVTLQRERREDRREAKQSMQAMKEEFRNDFAELKEELLQALTLQLAPVVQTATEAKAKADRSEKWISDIKLQGGAWALALMTFGGAVAWIMKLVWSRINFQ